MCLRNHLLCAFLFVFPLSLCLFGSSQDLGGCTVCHLTSETDTKSFGCDLFELMVQNIVSTPTPRGNFIGALGRYKWPVVYLRGQHTRQAHIRAHVSVHIHLLTDIRTRNAVKKITRLPMHAINGSHTVQCQKCDKFLI